MEKPFEIQSNQLNQCFDYVGNGEILVRKSYNVGKGLLMKNKKFEYENIPVQHMSAIPHPTIKPFGATKGSRDNVFQPNMRVRDSQVLTRDDTSFQMWMRVRFQQLRAPC